ncbi:biosynthetic-type acetolactate synthase large subunit [Phascolarctobacterium sp.]|uniref:biosynthetic-type acetolactate synthase large subunit n=1 Tax=Phascolarctobacterium sp. TaxID=2049039 RepID=UPI002A834D8A|nr:biosynthetic-type acetolactate synthase large subunit [Phascolarctobacterium sp.]MDY5045804.1 biosynthetic-type acetolactate synthase large subunit [Phascolarctobacterium sp.]
MNGAQAILESLRREEVDIVFGYPGGAVLDLYDAVYQAKFPHILTRHEQGAVHAADGYARATGKVGVCFATSGPGATNLITGIATANMDSIPMVCFTGQVGNPYIGKDSFQEADIVGITTPITKHNYLVKKVEQLPRIIKEAFFIARTGRPGPVVIDIAKDVFSTQFEYEYPKTVNLRGYSGEFTGNEEEIVAAVEAIKNAKRPLFFIGGGMTLSGQSKLFREVVKMSSIPVICSLMGLGCVPSTDEGFLGMVGMHGSYAANMAVQECDLLITLGARFDDRVTGKLSAFAPNAKIVHFEVDKAEINKNVPVDYPVFGDLRWSMPIFLNLMIRSVDDFESHIAEWRNHVIAMNKEHPFSYKQNAETILPQQLIEKVSDLVDDDTIVVTDVGQHQMWAAQFFNSRKPRQFLTSGGLGTMGYGLPAAMGAKLAKPNQRVVVFTGDGSIMMNIQELATMADNDIDVKIVLLHNSVLGMVYQWQKLFYGHRFSNTIMDTKVDFVKLAEAMGIKGVRIESLDGFEAKLKAALEGEGATLIDVILPPNEDVLPMVAPGAQLDNMVLGD